MKTHRKFKTVASFLILLLTVFTGCNKGKDNVSDNLQSFQSEISKSDANNFNSSPGSVITELIKSKNLSADKDFNFTSDNSSAGRLIIRTGIVSIETDNYYNAEKKIKEKAVFYMGYITGSNSNQNVSGKLQGSVTVRIPSDKFDNFIEDLKSAGKIISQNISASDVTEEFIDLEARQKTQRELEKRLLDLLSGKTAKLKDVVEVEEKLSAVRENIEKTEGRMKFLKSQSAFSTLVISISEPSLLQTSSGGGFFYEINLGLKKGMEGFTEVLSLMIAFAVSNSPFIILLFIILFIIRKYFRIKKIKSADFQTL
jgi:hypothetical protein